MAEKTDIISIEGLKIPEHVAIILDGNGRWAKKRHMPRNYGHSQGSKAVEQICEDAWNLGIKWLTVYAFSTENWKRSEKEIFGLMQLLRVYLKDCLKRAGNNNMRVRVIGEKSRLAPDIQAVIAELEEATKNNTGLCFQVALNYGSRDEIIRAVKRMYRDTESIEEITEESFSRYLDTGMEPDPDLLIRTSGEQRLSNFMLWQLAYTEFYFTNTLWPDFDKEELKKAILWYNGRDRRFGGI